MSVGIFVRIQVKSVCSGYLGTPYPCSLSFKVCVSV